MGWVGVGTLIATTGFLLYRYPVRSWTPIHPSPPPPDPRSETRRPSTSDEPQVKRDDAGPSVPESQGIEDEPEQAEQTTPKTSASSAPPPVLSVPALNLVAEETGDNDNTGVASASVRQNMNGTNKQPQPESPSRNDQTSATKPPQPPSPTPPSSQPRPPTLSTTSTNTSSLMPPQAAQRPRQTPQPNRGPPTNTLQPPRPTAGSSLMPLPSSASNLRVPTNSSSRLSNSTLAPTLKKSSASRKVVLEPGYSPLDWAALASNPKNQLRGAGLPPGLLRVTPSMLKTQNGRKGRDAWTSYQGKVYNITPYVPYHPGGKGELLRGAGKDSAQLFQEIHPWVNWDGILGECLVGILVSENDVQAVNSLDSMD